jgi:hypothetical protein
VGAVFNYIGMFFWTLAPDSNAICHLRLWFIFVGYSLLLGAMLSKAFAVHTIFHALKHDFKQLMHLVTDIKTIKVMKPISVIVGKSLVSLSHIQEFN